MPGLITHWSKDDHPATARVPPRREGTKDLSPIYRIQHEHLPDDSQERAIGSRVGDKKDDAIGGRVSLLECEPPCHGLGIADPRLGVDIGHPSIAPDPGVPRAEVSADRDRDLRRCAAA